MNSARILALIAIAAISASSMPASADPRRSNGPRQGNHYGVDAGHCPPGLAKKNPPCVPPGQVHRDDDRRSGRYGGGIGDFLRVDDYVLIRDPRGLNLEIRDDWRYYRDDDRAYRVDRDTRRILAVIDLIDLFRN